MGIETYFSIRPPGFPLYLRGTYERLEQFYTKDVPSWEVDKKLSVKQRNDLTLNVHWVKTAQGHDYWSKLYGGHRVVTQDDINLMTANLEPYFKPVDIKDFM